MGPFLRLESKFCQVAGVPLPLFSCGSIPCCKVATRVLARTGLEHLPFNLPQKIVGREWLKAFPPRLEGLRPFQPCKKDRLINAKLF